MRTPSPRMPSTTEQRTSRIPELDGLRAVAILLVILYHYLAPLHRSASGWLFAALAPARMGWVGVDLFFVVSGYLIASILITNRESTNYFSTFYIRRFCRILPLYLPVAVLFHLAHAVSNSGPQPSLLQYLTFTQNFWFARASSFGNGLLAITWSLAVEEQFYLLLPALVRFNRPRRFIVIVVACIGLAVALRYAFLITSGRDGFFPIQVLLPARLDSLMLGVAAAWLGLRGVTIPRPVLWIAWVVSGSWIASAAMNRTLSETVPHPFLASLFHLMIAMFCLSTLLIALGGGFRFLRWRGLTYTGLISYGLYLLHEPARILLHRFVPGLGPWLPIAAFVATFVAAAWSWEVFEKRFVRFGHRFHYDRTAPPPPSIAERESSPLMGAGV